jgi:hypothetical protein
VGGFIQRVENCFLVSYDGLVGRIRIFLKFFPSALEAIKSEREVASFTFSVDFFGPNS